jgi:amidohydrolase
MTVETDREGIHAIHPVIDELWPAIVAGIDARHQNAVRFRRLLHAHPESSGQEWHTTATVAETLRTMGFEPRVCNDDIGVTTELDLHASGEQVIALRAELDCVGVDDEKDVDYRSVNRGLCHACGHDAHTTIVLEAMAALHEHRETLRRAGLRCNVRAVFQPAEESAKGAASMIEQGAVDNVAAIFAVHVDPFLEVGRIGVRTGPLTSSSQVFEARVYGRSGHTARPFEAIDPIPAATNLVSLFYELGPRSMDPRYPLALSVAAFHAGAAYNAIPDAAIIGGTIRTTRLVDLDHVRDRMNRIARGVAEATDTRIEMDYQHFVPPTNNDATLIDLISRAGRDVLGPGGVQWIDVASLGAEDFSFYQAVVPGAIVRLGAALPDPRDRRALHNSRFDIDERTLAVGAKLQVRSVLYAAVGAMATPPAAST